jgi:peptide deformylase
MTVRNIVTPPNPTLRKKAQKVHTFGAPLQTLIDDMIETMQAAPGVGLAAPQVDISQRVIIVEYADPPEDPEAPPKPAKLYAVVNPEIARTSKETVLGNEACLSLPGFMGEVERYEWVTVKGQDRHGNDFKLKPKGFLARIFQHEIDHINGVLYIDRATEVWRVEEISAEQGLPAV